MGIGKITGDFETRSACNLLKAGAYAYSVHWSTQVMCLGYTLDGVTWKLWHRAHPALGIEESPRPQDLIDAIEAGWLFEAHNSFFERCIWANALRREFPWFPEVREEQWRCSAAKAAAFSLPRSLEDLANVLRLREKKDAFGSRVMLKLSKPKKPLKADREWMLDLGYDLDQYGRDPSVPLMWHENLPDLETLWRYCLQDVRTEHCASAALRDLSPYELRVWQMDQRMNARGIAVDLEGAKRALELIEEEAADLNDELSTITGGAVEKGSSRPGIKAWLNAHGMPVEDTQGATFDVQLMRKDLDHDVRRVMEICRDVNRTSTSKFKQMLLQEVNGFVYDLMMYHGANTGRWSGKLLQPHNFVRGFEGLTMDEVWRDIHSLPRDELRMLWGSIMEMLAKATRGALVAPEGYDLIVADYKAIEARVIVWLADDERALEMFRRGEDPYCDMADGIYKRPITKADNPKERQVGKTAILGLGFGMGWEKFADECIKNKVPQEDDFLQEIVRVYRKEKYPLVPKLWSDYNDGAIAAVKKPGTTVETGKVRWSVRGQFLHCRLPSARLLSYHRPHLRRSLSFTFKALNFEGKKRSIAIRLDPRTPNAQWAALRRAESLAKLRGLEVDRDEEPWFREQDSLCYYGTDAFKKTWGRIDTYGGKLVENVTQATARDLMADAMLNADESGVYPVLLSVHDELVSKVKQGEGDLKEFERLMSRTPAWAEGCPVDAEGWRGKRYRK